MHLDLVSQCMLSVWKKFFAELYTQCLFFKLSSHWVQFMLSILLNDSESHLDILLLRNAFQHIQ